MCLLSFKPVSKKKEKRSGCTISKKGHIRKSFEKCEKRNEKTEKKITKISVKEKNYGEKSKVLALFETAQKKF